MTLCHYAECCCAGCRDIFIDMLNVIILSVVMLSVIMLSVIMLSVIMLIVLLLGVVMLSVVVLSVIMLSVVMLNVATLSVVAPRNALQHDCGVIFTKLLRSFVRMGVAYPQKASLDNSQSLS